MGDPVAGVGAQFRRWDGAGSWASLASVKNIDGPTMTRDFIDTTALDTADGYRTFIAGFRDGGEVTITINFTRNVWELLLADFESDDEQNYEIVLPDSDTTSVEFAGLVTGLPLTIAPDDVITSVVVIKISGAPTLNSGSGPSP